MYTKLNKVIKFSNEYLHDITLEEIKNFAENVKIELTKEQISNWLLCVAKADGVDTVGDKAVLATQSLAELDENMIKRIAKEFVAEEKRKQYQLNEKDYDMYSRALRVYRDKCLKLYKILMLISAKQTNYELIEKLDLNFKGDSILTADLIRILKPLKKNYELAFALNLQANNYATYLDKIHTPITGKVRSEMPTESLINYSLKYSDEKIEMTEKQKEEWLEKHHKIMRNAFGLKDQY